MCSSVVPIYIKEKPCINTYLKRSRCLCLQTLDSNISSSSLSSGYSTSSVDWNGCRFGSLGIFKTIKSEWGRTFLRLSLIPGAQSSHVINLRVLRNKRELLMMRLTSAAAYNSLMRTKARSLATMYCTYTAPVVNKRVKYWSSSSSSFWSAFLLVQIRVSAFHSLIASKAPVWAWW